MQSAANASQETFPVIGKYTGNFHFFRLITTLTAHVPARAVSKPALPHRITSTYHPGPFLSNNPHDCVIIPGGQFQSDGHNYY